jgi:hypothetical protein
MGTIAAPADGIAAARLWEDSQISPESSTPWGT